MSVAILLTSHLTPHTSHITPHTSHLTPRHRWLYKLSERCRAWRKLKRFSTGEDELPEHLHEVLGDSDPPLASYTRCVQVVDMLESILPSEMYRTLTGLMFSILMDEESEIEDQHQPQDGSSGNSGYNLSAFSTLHRLAHVHDVADTTGALK